MAYLRILILTAATILSCVALLNYLVDPAGVYRPDRDSPVSYARALIDSRFGLWWPANSLEDRAIKKALAQYSDRFECVIIGSSHVMQLGSSTTRGSLKKECSSVVNLAVSGASIEDQFALTYLALKNGHPKIVVFGIAPWTFAYGKDQRWSYYESAFRQAKNRILGDHASAGDDDNHTTLRSKMRNLLSAAYSTRSLQKVLGDIETGSGRYAARPVPGNVDQSVGGEHPLLLPDGSLQYSAAYLAKVRGNPIPLGGEPYATTGALNEPNAIGDYRLLIRYVKSEGVKPVLLLTPYHQNVWKVGNSANTLALKATEQVVRQLGAEVGVQVIGSYNPDTLGCLDSEFLDFMHPAVDCLARLP